MDSNFLLKHIETDSTQEIGRIDWLEWDIDKSGNKRFGNLHNKPLVGRSLVLNMKPIVLNLMQPGNYERVNISPSYDKILPEIDELIEVRRDYIKFSNIDGTYEMFIKINTNKKPKGIPLGKA